MSWARFVTAIVPELVGLGRELYRAHRAEPTIAREQVRKMRDQSAEYVRERDQTAKAIREAKERTS